MPDVALSPEEDAATAYVVVRNQYGQHSIWPVGEPIPGGWTPRRFQGSKQNCLEHIEEVWLDPRLGKLGDNQEMLSGVID